MANDSSVYARIGMALVSAQRVEYLTRSLVTFLIDFNSDFKYITTEDFLDESRKFIKLKKPTLGNIFNQLQTTPKLVLTDDLDTYLTKRNILVHHLWKDYMFERTSGQAEAVTEFCNEFGKLSDNLEKFYKGFIYFLKLRYKPSLETIDTDKDIWANELEYFLQAITRKSLFTE